LAVAIVAIGALVSLLPSSAAAQSTFTDSLESVAPAPAQAQKDNGQSRIYLGIYWPVDRTQGIAPG
jgi:hypothetical protein